MRLAATIWVGAALLLAACASAPVAAPSAPQPLSLVAPARPVFSAEGIVALEAQMAAYVAEGAVKVDGTKTTDREARLSVGSEHILQLGPRRFARVQVSPP